MDDDINAFVATRILIGPTEVKATGKVQVTTDLVTIVFQNPTSNEIMTLNIKPQDVGKFILHLELKPTLMIYTIKDIAADIQNKINIYEVHTSLASIAKNWITIEAESLTGIIKNTLKRWFRIFDEVSRVEMDKLIESRTNVPVVPEKVVEKLPSRVDIEKTVTPEVQTNPLQRMTRSLLKRRQSVCADEMVTSVRKKQKKTASSSTIPDDTILFYYPPVSVNREKITVTDYKCLASGGYLNDRIINFCNRYLYEECLTREQQRISYIFDTFFYTMLKVLPDNMTHSQSVDMRYDRSEQWSNLVNIFEKDFVLVPINENDHWYMAVICYPGANIMVNNNSTKSFKRPCILMFDSISGTPQNATQILRQYMNFEYILKVKNGIEYKFDASNTPAHCVKVPLQSNTFDCGVFMLKFIEQFFKKPIESFDFPINLEDWFHQSEVSKKRRDIAQLIQTKMTDDILVEHLPQISLPHEN